MVSKRKSDGGKPNGVDKTNKGFDPDEVFNWVKIQGKLKKDPVQFETAVGGLINIRRKAALKVQIYTGDKSEYLSLAKRFLRFREGDTIQFRGYLDPWSKSTEKGWIDGLNVQITEIVNDPPQRDAEASTEESAEEEAGIPF